MLLYSGYDTKFALQRFTNDDFEIIEQFVKNSFSSIIGDQENLENYYGVFKDKPDQFIILPGHKKVILGMVNFFKNPPLKSKSSSTNSSQGAEKRKFGSKFGPTISDEISEDSNSDNLILETDTEKQQNLNVNLNSEENIIKKMISNWLNNISNTLQEGKDDPARDSVLKVITLARKNVLSVKIQCELSTIANMVCVAKICCLICQETIRVMKRSLKAGSVPIWVLSNFYKHLKTHLQVDKKKQRGSRQQGTLNAFIQTTKSVGEKNETDLVTMDLEVPGTSIETSNNILQEKRQQRIDEDTRPCANDLGNQNVQHEICLEAENTPENTDSVFCKVSKLSYQSKGEKNRKNETNNQLNVIS